MVLLPDSGGKDKTERCTEPLDGDTLSGGLTFPIGLDLTTLVKSRSGGLGFSKRGGRRAIPALRSWLLFVQLVGSPSAVRPATPELK